MIRIQIVWIEMTEFYNRIFFGFILSCEACHSALFNGSGFCTRHQWPSRLVVVNGFNRIAQDGLVQVGRAARIVLAA